MTAAWNVFLDGVAETGVTLPAFAKTAGLGEVKPVETTVRHPDPSLWGEEEAAKMRAIQEGKL
jgi:hypothetical protein